MSFAVYMLRCGDDSYYVGHTEDLATRLAQHQSGQAEGYTASRLPVALVWSESFPDRDQAFQVERQLKGWSRAKKEALIRGDFDAIQLLSRKLFLKNPDPLILSSRESGVSKDAPCFDTEPAAPTQHERDEMAPFNPGPVIILVRPQLGENIGKAARAMLNFGLTEMRLVAPRDGWPNPSAGPAASGADQVLSQAQVFDTVAEAIADCSTVFAATVRRRELMTPVVGPEQMAATIHAEAGRSAILFGPERSGLETEDVAVADAIVTIPINPQFGSINLAQAVILLAYEWSKGQALAQPTVRELEPVAPHADLDGLLAQLDEQLEAAGYFYPPERTQATRLTLRTIFTKARWTTREIKAIRGVLRGLVNPRVRG